MAFNTVPTWAEETSPQPEGQSIGGKFLEILPKALEIDQSIRLAEISYEATLKAQSVQIRMVSKADITLSSANNMTLSLPVRTTVLPLQA